MQTYFKNVLDTGAAWRALNQQDIPPTLILYVAETDTTQVITNPAYEGLDLSTPFTVTAVDACEFYIGGRHYASLDGGQTWTLCEHWEGRNYQLAADDTLMLKSDYKYREGSRWNTDNFYETSNDSSHRYKFSGNLMSLYCENNYYKCYLPDDTELVEQSAFQGTFRERYGLVDAGDLIMPYNVQRSCFFEMFYGCSNLVTPPAFLPAKRTKDDCYGNMFGNCTSLTSVPYIHTGGSDIKHGVYQGMFQNCTSLTSVTQGMYLGTVTGETTVQIYETFKGCTNLTNAPAFNVLGGNMSLHRAFDGCSSLTDVSGIHIYGGGDNDVFYECFKGCSSLDHFEIYGENWPDFNSSTFDGCAASGTFTVPAVTNYDPNDYIGNGIPSGWTIQRAS